jgi:PAS domain S-box-containing protein
MNLPLNKILLHRFLLFLIIVLSVLYYRFTWILNRNEGINDVLQIARSVEASLPKDEIKTLQMEGGSDTHLNEILMSVINVNPKAFDAYIYTERNGKTIQLADAKIKRKGIATPHGENFIRENKFYFKAIQEGKPFVTHLSTGNWGQWISVFVPVRNETTGNVIAVLGMDFSASTWNQRLIYEMAESSVLILMLLFALNSLSKIDKKNSALTVEISERKQAEQSLYEVKEQLEFALNATNDGLWDVRLDSPSLYISPRGCEILGYKPGELEKIKNAWSSLVHPEDLPLTMEALNNYLHGETPLFIVEQRLKTSSGDWKWILARGKAVAFDQEGKAVRMVGTHTDIDERKIAEEKLKNYGEFLEETVKKRTAELEAAKEQAESADRLKSAFLITMSHELRTPLNSVIGFSGILLKEIPGLLNEEQKKQVEFIQGSEKYLLSLINDILDLSKIEAGQMSTWIEPFDLENLIEEIVKTEGPSAERKGISLIFEKNDEPVIISSDKQRVHQIILNILNNAIKFTEKGSVDIKTLIENREVRIAITDTGIGIRSEDIENIFAPFIQVNNELTREHEGTGLGLSISKKLADILGGTLNVKSRLGEGSVFTITLPVNRNDYL